jgi:RNA polymerase sigma-70 factor (ECF subfamily)
MLQALAPLESYLEKLSDEKLMARYQKGDLRAFNLLLQRHRRGIFNFVLRFTANHSVAEDLVQDVFLRVVKSAGSFQQRSKFTTWLYTIARNICIDHLRKMRHRKHPSLDQPIKSSEKEGLRLMDKIDNKAQATDERAHNQRIRKNIVDAIESLNDEQREVFLMREESGLPFDEIAKIVGAPLNTVKSRMRYALQNLRANLLEQGVEP